MNTELLEQLQQLHNKDTETRAKMLQAGRLHGEYAPELQQVHRENAEALDKLVSEHGWPTVLLVGAKGAQLAWEIAQHANCTPDLQRKFFKLLGQAAAHGEAAKRHVALLSDRIRFNEGRPQIYGTVLDWDEQGELTCTLQNPDMVDELRKAVSLPPFEQSLQEQRQTIIDEGGKPPADLDAYRQQQEAWAQQAGWR